MVVGYDGADYLGFQRQLGKPTIQGELERALSKLTGETATITGAGRTDAGVHARGQVVHFRTEWPGPVDRLPVAVNPLLPAAIRVIGARQVSEEFHARYSARFRRYGYALRLSDRPDPMRERFAYRVKPTLDQKAMKVAAGCLPGRRDFRAFASDLPTGGAVDTVRTVQQARWLQRGSILVFLIQADGFLRHMVRNIVGCLLAVGAGQWDAETFRSYLEAGQGRMPVRPAPPAGLCLLRVGYRDVAAST